VHHAAQVRGVQARRRLRDDVQRAVDRQRRLAVQQVRQGLASTSSITSQARSSVSPKS
jgi:hypothetical protein